MLSRKVRAPQEKHWVIPRGGDLTESVTENNTTPEAVYHLAFGERVQRWGKSLPAEKRFSGRTNPVWSKAK